jgi:hypothetical protein
MEDSSFGPRFAASVFLVAYCSRSGPRREYLGASAGQSRSHLCIYSLLAPHEQCIKRKENLEHASPLPIVLLVLMMQAFFVYLSTRPSRHSEPQVGPISGVIERLCQAGKLSQYLSQQGWRVTSGPVG